MVKSNLIHDLEIARKVHAWSHYNDVHADDLIGLVISFADGFFLSLQKPIECV